jgi:hypothetical protein
MRHLGALTLVLWAISGCGSGGTGSADETGGPAATTEQDTSVGADESTGMNATGGESSSESEGSSGTEGSTGEVVGCYEPYSDGETPFERFTCGGAAVCDVLVAERDRNDPSDALVFVNPEAATCILEGLRDATPGTYRADVSPDPQSNSTTDIEVLTDGTAIVHRRASVDKGSEETGRWAPLLEPQTFQDCLDSGDLQTILDCIENPLDDASCIEGPTVCP